MGCLGLCSVRSLRRRRLRKKERKKDESAFTRPAGFAAGKNGRSESVKATGKPDRPENASAEGDGEDERSVAEDDYVADGRQFDGHVR